MNIYNTKFFRALIKFFLMRDHEKFYLYKFLPINWQDNEGNNLFHYSALLSNMEIFNRALENKAVINHPNNKGIYPIHNVIFSCFKNLKQQTYKQTIKEKLNVSYNEIKVKNIEFFKTIKSKNKKIATIDLFKSYTTCLKKLCNEISEISYKKENDDKELLNNKELLESFINAGANVNVRIITEENNTINTTSIKFHKNTPIELLIQYFYTYILHPKFNNLEQFEIYKDLYMSLSKAGANINFIKDDNKVSQMYYEDAMEEEIRHIVSHFFIKYISSNAKFYAILPLLEDPNIDFKIEDNHSNTLLHNLFGRMFAKSDLLEQQMIEKIFKAIWDNPSFDTSYLEIENSFRLKPLKLFKHNTEHYKSIFEKFRLFHKLSENLPQKKDIQKKIKL